MSLEGWNKLFCSEKGKKFDNQDFIIVESVSFSKTQVDILIVCDGVGGKEGGKECSHLIGTKAVQVLKKYLAQKRAKTTFKDFDTEKVRKIIGNIHFSEEEKVKGATTLTILLFDRNKDDNKNNLITIWAGDSRAYAIQTDGSFLQLTEDHHDDESSLTGFVTGSGRVRGQLGVKFFGIESVCAVAVTTDGVHESCETRELKNFFLHCIEQRIKENEEYTQLMKDFLMDNISDNYSSALIYQFLTDEQLSQIATTLGN